MWQVTGQQKKMEAKPRHIVLEAHVIAYLGHYICNFEESIKRRAASASASASAAAAKTSQKLLPVARAGAARDRGNLPK